MNGKKFPVMFDTGHTTDAALALNGREQAKLPGIPIPDDAAVTTTSGASGLHITHCLRPQNEILGPIEQFNARIHVSDEERNQRTSLLSLCFLPTDGNIR
ncbi:MAG: hypothetical protein R3D26_22615 [Cyanobacteriota/Melainabacteria group bacterium]